MKDPIRFTFSSLISKITSMICWLWERAYRALFAQSMSFQVNIMLLVMFIVITICEATR